MTSVLCKNAGMTTYCVSGYSRKGDLGDLDRNGLTPVLTAAAYENDDAFNTMVDKGRENTLFQAAKKPDKTNIHALRGIVVELQVPYLSSSSCLPILHHFLSQPQVYNQ